MQIVCMEYQILSLGKNKKNILKCLYAEIFSQHAEH